MCFGDVSNGRASERLNEFFQLRKIIHISLDAYQPVEEVRSGRKSEVPANGRGVRRGGPCARTRCGARRGGRATWQSRLSERRARLVPATS